MPIINFTNSYNILIAIVLYVLILYISKEMKRSSITCIMLLIFLTIIAGHSIEYAIVKDTTGEITSAIANCIAVDFIFIFLSFIGYLWIDDIESKEKKTKSIDNSLDWFWKKV